MTSIDKIPTGHLDREKQMICEGDTVLVTVRPHFIKTDYTKEPTRAAQVAWAGDCWVLFYNLYEQEPLNNYHSEELLKQAN